MTAKKAAHQSGWNGDALTNPAAMVKRDATLFAIVMGDTSVTLAVEMLARCIG